MRQWTFKVVVWLAALGSGAVRAEPPMLATTTAPTPPRLSLSNAPLPNVPLPTLGGDQFWSDELVYQGWRIQLNALTGLYRLLDPRDVRQAWGTYEQCQTAFDDVKRREMLPPLDGRAVLTLHGLVRSREHMEGIGRFLEQEGHFTWVNVSYASTRRTLDEHAQSLARVVAGLEGIDEIDFVCHSLGNLVVRRYLGEANEPQPRWQPDPRIKRMVMLGPPNNGARLAEMFKNNELLGLIYGPSAKQLAREWSAAEKLLATPAFPFGIIAGGRGDDRGVNPLLDGDDDLIVSVAETRLPGAADFRVVPCLHGRLMDDTTVRGYALNFLQHGYFISAEQRQPITAPANPHGASQP